MAGPEESISGAKALVAVSSKFTHLIDRLRSTQQLDLSAPRTDNTPYVRVPDDIMKSDSIHVGDAEYLEHVRGEYLSEQQFRAYTADRWEEPYYGGERTIDPVDLCFYSSRSESGRAYGSPSVPPTVFAFFARRFARSQFYNHQELTARQLWGPNSEYVVALQSMLRSADNGSVKSIAKFSKMARGIADVWTRNSPNGRDGYDYDYEMTAYSLCGAKGKKPDLVQVSKVSKLSAAINDGGDPFEIAKAAGFENRYTAMLDIDCLAHLRQEEKGNTQIDAADDSIVLAMRAVLVAHLISPYAYAILTHPLRMAVGELPSDHRYLSPHALRLIDDAGLGRHKTKARYNIRLGKVVPFKSTGPTHNPLEPRMAEAVDRPSGLHVYSAQVCGALAALQSVIRSYAGPLVEARRAPRNTPTPTGQVPVPQPPELFPTLLQAAVTTMAGSVDRGVLNETAALLRHSGKIEDPEVRATLRQVLPELKSFLTATNAVSLLEGDQLDAGGKEFLQSLASLVGVSSEPALNRL